MNKYVPFQATYKRVDQIENLSKYCAYIAAIFITVNWFIESFQLTETILVNMKLGTLIDPLKVGSYAFITFFLIFELVAKILFSEAERTKREDLIDNSFGTAYSDVSSKGYYNNDELSFGIIKFALNTYESSFHTLHVLKAMLINSSIRLLLISIPFVLSIFANNGSTIVRLLFEISIPLVLFFNVIVLVIYFVRVREINTRFKSELLSISKNDRNELTNGKLLNPIMDYYNTKAWANINLDSNEFEKLNESVSESWLERKEKLGIETTH